MNSSTPSLPLPLTITNGGTGATTAGGARTNLGGTTVGINYMTLANPSAITYPQMNADNTISALSASAFLAAIGGGGGSPLTTKGDLTGYAVYTTTVTDIPTPGRWLRAWRVVIGSFDVTSGPGAFAVLNALR